MSGVADVRVCAGVTDLAYRAPFAKLARGTRNSFVRGADVGSGGIKNLLSERDDLPKNLDLSQAPNESANRLARTSDRI